MTQTTATAHYARRPNSPTSHIVTGLTGWYSGMTMTTECGVKHAAVDEQTVDRDVLDVRACRRCMKILGWDLPRSLPSPTRELPRSA